MPSSVPAPASPIRIIGVGNRWGGDDAAGLAVVEALAARLPDGVAAFELEGDVPSLLEALSGASAAIIVDAMRSGAQPGTVCRFEVTRSPLPANDVRFSTHSVGLGDALELARAMALLPPITVVYGVRGTRFGPGRTLSPGVAQSISLACEQIAVEARAIRRAAGGRGNA